MFYLIRRNTYPYDTLHTERCGAVGRSMRAESLSRERIGRLEIYRINICSRCLPRELDAYGLPAGYHPDHLELFRIQREYKAEQEATSTKYTLARQVVALELALTKTWESVREAGIATDATFSAALAEYRSTMADGTYTPDELDVTVGRASITKRPNRSY
jgi:hypothetical protein